MQTPAPIFQLGSGHALQTPPIQDARIWFEILSTERSRAVKFHIAEVQEMEANLPRGCKVHFDDPNKLHMFTVTISEFRLQLLFKLCCEQKFGC